MEHHKELLHVRLAEEVMGWTNVEPSREEGRMKFYGTLHTNRGTQRYQVGYTISLRHAASPDAQRRL